MKTTKSTHAKFFKLLKQLPGAEKEDLVFAHSGEKTTSLAEFYSSDRQGYGRMITNMQSLVRMQQEQVKKYRSAILYRLQKHGVDTTSWDRVNAFLEQPRIAGKRLYQMTTAEMQELIPKLEAILQHDRKVQKEKQRLTLNN